MTDWLTDWHYWHWIFCGWLRWAWLFCGWMSWAWLFCGWMSCASFLWRCWHCLSRRRRCNLGCGRQEEEGNRSPFYIGITIVSIIVITVTFMVRSGPFKKFISIWIKTCFTDSDSLTILSFSIFFLCFLSMRKRKVDDWTKATIVYLLMKGRGVSWFWQQE